MSNMTPQDHGFNDGIWAHLENKVRSWAKKYGEVFVVSGPIFKAPVKKIGKDKVSVPSYFYKVILAPEGNTYKGIAFIIPNKNLHESYFHYTVSIDSVEKATSIDFFPLLPDTAEKRIESTYSLEQWR
jgi:endonuclease G